MNPFERERRDPRSTAELVDTALAEAEQDDDFFFGKEDGYVSALVALHARGTAEVLTYALALCGSPDPKRRELGARILGELGLPKRTFPEECCDALLELVRHDGDREVLIAAIFALGHLRNQRCEPDLIALRNHPDRRVRRGVAFTLCGSESPATVNALLELMDDPYERARDWATHSIGQTLSIDGPEVRAALLRRANDSDEITRTEALHGLALRRDERTVPYLLAELSAVQEHPYLFDDAAKAYLGLDEEQKIEREALLSALRTRRP